MVGRQGQICLRDRYYAGRPIRILDGGGNTVTGAISSSSYSSPTLTVNLSGISLASGNPTKVELGPAMKAGGGRVILDDDEDSYISASTDDQVDITISGTAQVEVKDGSIGPTTDSDVDLGTTSKRFKDAYVDTLTTTGNVTVGGTISGTLADSVLGTVYPVGSVYINATNDANPNTLLGFGTWARFGQGKMLISQDSSNSRFDTAEETGGSESVTLTEAQMPTHFHGTGSFIDDTGNRKVASEFGVNGTSTGDYATAGGSGNGSRFSMKTDSKGSGDSHDNMPPFITVYMWKRTA